jgi:hypothetical protein
MTVRTVNIPFAYINRVVFLFLCMAVILSPLSPFPGNYTDTSAPLPRFFRNDSFVFPTAPLSPSVFGLQYHDSLEKWKWLCSPAPQVFASPPSVPASAGTDTPATPPREYSNLVCRCDLG